MMHPVGSYQPGTSLAHRIPAGTKLSLLLGFGVLIALLPLVIVYPAAMIMCGLCAIVVGMSSIACTGVWPTAVFRKLRLFWLVFLLLGAFQVWQHGWPSAVQVVGGLVGLVLAATAFTSTTSVEDLLDTITHATHPLSRFNISPDRIALTISLAIRAIPLTQQLAVDTRSAAQARGLERNPRAFLIPFTIRAVAQAHLTGDALAARGIGDNTARIDEESSEQHSV